MAQLATRPPSPRARNVNFRLTQDEYAALQQLAWGQGCHVATYVTHAMRAAIKAASIRAQYETEPDRLVG